MMTPEAMRRFNRYRWGGFALLCLIYMLVFFHRMATGAVSEDLETAFDTTATQLGALAGAYYIIYTAMQIPAGIVSDTLGPRYTIALTGFVAAAGTFVFATADNFAMAAVGRVMIGFGLAFVFVGMMKYNSMWFSDRVYGRISGLTVLLGNVGAVMAGTPLSLLLDSYSWRHIFIGLGLLGVALSILTLLLLRNKPTDVGFADLRATPKHVPWKVAFANSLKNRYLWFGFFIMFGISGPVFAFAGLWGMPLMRDVHGLDRNAASTFTSTMLIGLAVGSVTCGWLSDLLGKRKPVIIGCVLMTFAGWLCMLFTPWQPDWSGYLIFLACGLGSGGIVAVYAAARELAPAQFSGMSIALVNTGLFLGATIVLPGFGWFMELTWNGATAIGQRGEPINQYQWADYQNGLWFFIALSVIALYAAFRIRETYCQNISAELEREQL